MLLGFPATLDGDVSFTLSIDDSVVSTCAPGAEFCNDLVISDNNGVLFGLAGPFGFTTKLQGALDCESGKFEAKGLEGEYGFPDTSDPNDPDAPLVIAEPAVGTFDGELNGMHTFGATETIDGQWELMQPGIGGGFSCDGQFHVELQP